MGKTSTSLLAEPGLGGVSADGLSNLARASRPVLERARTELEGAELGLLLADRTARLLEVPLAAPALQRTFDSFGLGPGFSLSEEDMGANAVGTPVETREGLLLRGDEHPAEAFHAYTCYGHPIIHPVTRRVEGVVSLSRPVDDEDRLMVPFVRRLVAEVEARLQHAASESRHLLMDAFQTVARRGRRPVMAIGPGLVLGTPAALDLLEPADHAVVRACAEDARPGAGAVLDVVLTSGRPVRLACSVVEGASGVLVEIIPAAAGRPAQAAPVTWPLLVVGERGSGRTTQAQAATGPGAVIVDAVDVVTMGERAWAGRIEAVFENGGSPIIVENIQLLSECLSAFVAAALQRTARHVVLTATPGLLGDAQSPLAAACGSRQELLPLRRRRHEVPRLAEEMLAEEGGLGSRRLTAETLRVLAGQPWPGNLTELRRVVKELARLRSTGDIVPSDLPPTHRGVAAPPSPLRQAEREVLLAAIEAAGGNKLKAARALGMSRSTLYNRMRALKIY